MHFCSPSPQPPHSSLPPQGCIATAEYRGHSSKSVSEGECELGWMSTPRQRRRGETQSSHPHSRGGATWLGEELQWARARQRHSAVGAVRRRRRRRRRQQQQPGSTPAPAAQRERSSLVSEHTLGEGGSNRVSEQEGVESFRTNGQMCVCVGGVG